MHVSNLSDRHPNRVANLVESPAAIYLGRCSLGVAT